MLILYDAHCARGCSTRFTSRTLAVVMEVLACPACASGMTVKCLGIVSKAEERRNG